MQMSQRRQVQIRDPIHGSILVSDQELKLVETPVFQRLRGIKQLGFTDHAFPGATHTRFAHSLGAMEMATRMFDAVFPAAKSALPEQDRARFRQLLRLAVLLHDVGHPPLSHATEGCMPPRSALNIPGVEQPDKPRRADHEDYTSLLILDSSLTELIEAQFASLDIAPRDVAHVIGGDEVGGGKPLLSEGIDFEPLLRQMVSGELDADRMDYLQRDSYHAGVDYGRFDRDWLLANMGFHVVEDRAYLAIYHRAIFAFEDFLLSRYHMFVSVYYHHSSVGFDAMLSRYIDEQLGKEPRELDFPTSSGAYIDFDDVAFWSILRASQNQWAQRIVRRNIYRRILEVNAADEDAEIKAVERGLQKRGFDFFVSRDESVLSRYYLRAAIKEPIYVTNLALGRATRIDSYSKLFERYAQPARLTRVYCRPDQVKEARASLRDLLPRSEQLRLAW
jgi:HD superfamily phosphohydrolase